MLQRCGKQRQAGHGVRYRSPAHSSPAWASCHYCLGSGHQRSRSMAGRESLYRESASLVSAGHLLHLSAQVLMENSTVGSVGDNVSQRKTHPIHCRHLRRANSELRAGEMSRQK